MNKKNNFLTSIMAFIACLLVFSLSLFINIFVFQSVINTKGENEAFDTVHTSVSSLEEKIESNIFNLKVTFDSLLDTSNSLNSMDILFDFDGIAFFNGKEQLGTSSKKLEIIFEDNNLPFIYLRDAVVYYGIPLQAPFLLSETISVDLIVVYVSISKTFEDIKLESNNILSIVNNANEIIYTNKEIGESYYSEIDNASFNLVKDDIYYTESENAVICVKQILDFPYYYIEVIPQAQKITFYESLTMKTVSMGIFNVSVFSIIILIAKRQKFYYKEKEGLKSTKRYISEVSHELRNPLNGILGLQEMLRQSIDDKDQMLKYIQQMEGSTIYMKKLVNDITDISKAESGRILFNEQIVDLESLVKSTAKMLEIQLNSKNINLSIQTSLRYRSVYVDSTRFMQVLINLVSNAIKFSNEGGLVVLQVSQDLFNKKETKLVVSDTGCGMSSEFLKKIWIPFSQENRMFHQESSGIGTTITKMIVEQMGGSISVWSEIGKGSTFTVTLPLKPAEVEEKPVENIRVLIAEDNDIQREVLETYLTKEKISVTCASNGEEAIKLFEENSNYNVIILDNKMPKLTGIETFYMLKELMKQKSINIPIIMSSGEEERVEGIFAYLNKPYSMEELRNIIASASNNFETT